MLAGGELQSLAHALLEARRLRRDLVFAGLEERDSVFAGGFGHGFGLVSGPRFGGHHLGLGNGSALRIGDAAAKGAAELLREQGGGRATRENNCEFDSHRNDPFFDRPPVGVHPF
jgi:hypothetical protein